MISPTAINEPSLIKVKINDLKFDKTNPNQLTREQMAGLRESMQKFGYLTPIIIDQDFNIADGEHRALIYKEFSIDEIPAYQLNLQDDTERRILRQVMNKLHGEHNKQLDADELATIFENNRLEDLSKMIAAQQDDLKRLIQNYRPDVAFNHIEEYEQITEEDLKRMVPDAQLGEIYQLGNHRIVCADATDSRSVDRLLEDKQVDMVFTDPPYNIMGSSQGFTKMDDDSMVRPFFRAIVYLIVNNLKLDGHAYICCNWRSYLPIALEAKSAELTPKNLIVWHKPNVRLGNMYVSSHEFLYFLSNEQHKHRLNPSVSERKVRTIPMSESNVWTISVDTYTERQHFAEKPTVLCAKAIRNSSDENDIVFDPFIGSGSTLIACEQLERKCYGIEIDPRYVDVTIKRWEKYTGQKAVKLT